MTVDELTAKLRAIGDVFGWSVGTFRVSIYEGSDGHLVLIDTDGLTVDAVILADTHGRGVSLTAACQHAWEHVEGRIASEIRRINLRLADRDAESRRDRRYRDLLTDALARCA